MGKIFCVMGKSASGKDTIYLSLIHILKRKDKIDVLTRLWDHYNPNLSLVFCNTKKMVDELAYVLCGRGYSAEGLHVDMKQVQRDSVMKNFRNGKTDILIATDVAARGIDVDDVEAVFNYDLPQDDELSLIHILKNTSRMLPATGLRNVILTDGDWM